MLYFITLRVTMVIKFIITQGLGHMHGLNILHRDLKTANILLTKAGVIKLADFGIAKVITLTCEGYEL